MKMRENQALTHPVLVWIFCQMGMQNRCNTNRSIGGREFFEIFDAKSDHF